MKALLIIKAGETFPALADRHGDFDHWIMTRLGILSRHVRVVRPYSGEPLPTPHQLSGVVITGSHAMLSDHAPWSEHIAAWIPEAISAQIPLLGICYGHQLLAYALGGQVDDNPLGCEFGTVQIRCRRHAKKDPLFGKMPPVFNAHTSHVQSVLRLPPKATLLASSNQDPHHAFSINRIAWGIQFHPEFDADITRAYISECAHQLGEEGQNPQHLSAAVSETPDSEKLLRCFGRIVREADPSE
jgi:GMP synthase (glutamine-hydrolysing)